MRKIIIPVLTLVVSALMFSVTALAQQKYSASLNSLQENPATNSSGRGNCLITLNAGETQFTISCTYSGLSAAATAGHVHDNGPVGVNGPVRFNFNVTGAGTSGTIGPLTFAVTPAQVADLRRKHPV